MSYIDYANAINFPTLGTIKINGEEFTGISYQGLSTVNTKTYVEEPQRQADGSISNINQYETFVVPRIKINIGLMNIKDYQRLCVAVRSNEFVVEYFDKQFGVSVSHKMYCEPEEMAKLYNVGTSVIGILDYEISFVGTLNDRDTYTLAYNINGGGTAKTISDWSVSVEYSKDDVVKSDSLYYLYINETASTGEAVTNTDYWKQIINPISENSFYWGESTVIPVMSTLQYFYNVSAPLIKWNTKADGTGFNFYPNQSTNIFENMTLYAQWEAEA